jgi:hypothetical protein
MGVQAAVPARAAILRMSCCATLLPPRHRGRAESRGPAYPQIFRLLTKGKHLATGLMRGIVKNPANLHSRHALAAMASSCSLADTQAAM